MTAKRILESIVPPLLSQGLTYLQSQLNRSEIVATVERCGLRLVREFDMGAHPPVANAPEQPTCLGWLFQRDCP